MSTGEVILEKKDGIATLTLNRPERYNAVTLPMYREIVRILEDISTDDTTGTLIITGTGHGFCAGMDISVLSEARRMTESELHEMMRAMVLAFDNLPQPAIAAVNGVAAGLGLSLVLLCDIRIGAENATFTSGYARMALTPDIGTTYWLPRTIGTSRALEMMLTGASLSAAEAERIGLINRVVAPEALLAEAEKLAGEIALGAPTATRLTKQAIRKGTTNTLEAQITLESASFHRCLQSEDSQEGVNSFREKRPPRFRGK